MKTALTIIIFCSSLILTSCSSNKNNESETMDSNSMNTEADGYNEATQDRTGVLDSMSINQSDTAVLIRDTVMNR